jgi:hypothetical protein
MSRIVLWLRVAAYVVGILALAWYLNPTHLRHVAKLMPGPAPADLIDWSKIDPAARAISKPNHPPTSNTKYHNHIFFSTTTNTITGARGSVGVLGMVFDLRTVEQRAAEQRQIDELRIQESLKSVNVLLKNLERFKTSPEMRFGYHHRRQPGSAAARMLWPPKTKGG